MIRLIKRMVPVSLKRNIKQLIPTGRQTKRLFKRLVPASLERNIKRLIPYYRDNPGLDCPVCGNHERRFDSFGLIPRPNAQCPNCIALERHRFAWLFLQKFTDLFDRKPQRRMLHFAPEPVFLERLSALKHLDYLTADLLDPSAMVQVDITNIQFPDESFDILFCSHVLEHIPDDRRAMRECFRVLKRSGWAVFQVPVDSEQTIEASSVIDAKEREHFFDQFGHVRSYGPDFQDRLTEAGFLVTAYRPADIVHDPERYAIPATSEPLYYCKKV